MECQNCKADAPYLYHLEHARMWVCSLCRDLAHGCIPIEVWFSGEEFPYCLHDPRFRSVADADAHWRQDPDYIGCNRQDTPEGRPPVVIEAIRHDAAIGRRASRTEIPVWTAPIEPVE